MELDMRSELAVFPWTRATWTEDKLVAASPFRYDRTPSFYVWLRDNPVANARAGYWQDYGASDPEYQRGGPVKLLAFLRNETEEETREYLRWRYGYGGEVTADPDELTLDLSVTLRPPAEPYRPLDVRILDEYAVPHSYLSSRGISEDVQRMFRTGYSPRQRAVTIPWFNADGTLGNVKYRRVDEKTFWYVKGGRPIREMVYGLHIVYERGIRRVALVEAEIDAMYLWTAGVPAVAVGGSAFSEEKAELLRKSPIEELRVATDNDEAGAKLKAQVFEKMAGYCELYDVEIPKEYKDVNEVRSAEEVRGIVEGAVKCGWKGFPLLSQ
ncbi:toprim domain-containing protein [Brevibacillus borstelensis]|uniref:toprim domain-containing protein n=1 Tax=Brevibacillus borstelensis TaxID=45462 RepID=UPI00287F8EF8|nr:toprim domain-containing protein [Brevibacillus borstelensis]WNF07436.1 toprim domain-containing protein [Brevibacillus borstelensis]